MPKEKEPKVGGTEEETGKEENKKTSVSSSDVEKLLNLVEELSKGQKDLQAKVEESAAENKALQEQLEFISDKGRFSKWQQKQIAAGAKERIYKLQMFDGKLVVGWTSMKTNLIYKKENGAYVEDQTTTLIFEDNSQKDVRYDNWQAQRVAVEMPLEKQEELKDGHVIYTLKKPDGSFVSVDSTFVN